MCQGQRKLYSSKLGRERIKTEALIPVVVKLCLQFSILSCILLAENLTFKGISSILRGVGLSILEFLQLVVSDVCMSVCSSCPESQRNPCTPVWPEAAAVLSTPALPHRPPLPGALASHQCQLSKVRKTDLLTNLRERPRTSCVLWIAYTALRSIKEAVSVGELKWAQALWLVWALA